MTINGQFALEGCRHLATTEGCHQCLLLWHASAATGWSLNQEKFNPFERAARGAIPLAMEPNRAQSLSHRVSDRSPLSTTWSFETLSLIAGGLAMPEGSSDLATIPRYGSAR